MNNALADKLLLLRRNKSLSQKEAAAGIGITPAALSSYEKGQREPPLDFTIRIAKYYGISMDELCGLSAHDQPKAEISSVKTKADIMRIIELIMDSLPNMCIETDVFIHPDFENSYRVSFTYTSEDNWLSDFVDTYTNLKALYNKGDIGQEVLDAWKEKKHKDAQSPIL